MTRCQHPDCTHPRAQAPRYSISVAGERMTVRLCRTDAAPLRALMDALRPVIGSRPKVRRGWVTEPVDASEL